MIERVNTSPLSAAGLSKAFAPGDHATGSVAGLGDAQPGLAEQVKIFTGTIAGIGAASPSQVARLENATLDFAREVKALRIGAIDQPPTTIDAHIAAAVANGNSAAEALPQQFDAIDRVTTALSVAAQNISDTQSAPLIPAATIGETK
jgi:hypothetical protein